MVITELSSGSTDNTRLSQLYNDEWSEMTYGRRLAKILSKKKWYYPKSEDHEQMGYSLDDGWAYFEHTTLGRYVLPGEEILEASLDENNHQTTRDLFVRSVVGENRAQTRLYSIWRTGNKDMADFGIGVGMYFIMIKSLIMILIMAFVMNLSTVFYNQTAPTAMIYNGGSSESLPLPPVSPVSLLGSSVCVHQQWRPCLDCAAADWDEQFPRIGKRYAESKDGELSFILKNECAPFTFSQGMPTYVSMVFVVVALLVLRILDKRKVVRFDETQQTTSDYSIVVTNPPPDARDPEEWKEFVLEVANDNNNDENEVVDDEASIDSSTSGNNNNRVRHHVTCCTIVLNNEPLVKALAHRAKLMVKLESKLPANTRMQELHMFDHDRLRDLCRSVAPPPKWQSWLPKVTHDGDTLLHKIIKQDDKIQTLSEKHQTKSDVIKIVLTFEREQTQRLVLRRLLSRRHKYKFQYDHSVKAREPAEPSSVRWLDIDDTKFAQTCRFLLSTTLCTIFTMASTYVIYVCKTGYQKTWLGLSVPALAIFLLNKITPKVVKTIMHMESHKNEGLYQTSMFLKMIFFRCGNTVVLLYLVTASTDTLSYDGLLKFIYSLFLTEFISKPILHLIDIKHFIYRHVAAPRALDRRRLFSQFEGHEYNLADQYTAALKMFMLALFYAAIFPTGFLYAALALGVMYWIDKIALLRKWKRAPNVGAQVHELSHDTFFPMAMLSMSIVSGYLCSGRPFDNVCAHPSVSVVPQTYLGAHDITDLDGHALVANVRAGDPVYTYCDQSIRQFPVFSRYQTDIETGRIPWMTSGQALLVDMYAYTSILMIVLALTSVSYSLWKRFSVKTYAPRGKPSNIPYTQVAKTSGAPAYIPKIQVDGLEYPLLLCDLRDLQNKDIVGYQVHNKRLENLSLIYGVRKMRELREQDLPSDPMKTMFSTFRYWKPLD